MQKSLGAKDEVELVPVSDEAVSIAYSNFLKVFYPDYGPGMGGKGWFFWYFVGLKYAPKWGKGPMGNKAGWYLPDKVADKINRLTGPNYYTIAKAMEANGARWDIDIRLQEDSNG